MIELMLQAERLLMVGLVDQAEQLYAMAARNDPRNAIAVVGLARVALERNDDRQAYALSCRALEIDPEDAAALRLEARLSEVLAHRGERVERHASVLGSRAPVLPAPSQSATAPQAGPGRRRLLRQLLGR